MSITARTDDEIAALIDEAMYRRETTAKLVHEIGKARNALASSLDIRSRHATCGITKAALRSQYDRLRGLCEAWMYVTGSCDSGWSLLWDGPTLVTIRDQLGVDLLNLATAIKDA